MMRSALRGGSTRGAPVGSVRSVGRAWRSGVGLVAFAAGGAALAGVACSSDQPNAVGGVEVIVTAEGLVAPTDFDDIHLQVAEEVDAGVWNTLWDSDYSITSSPVAITPADASSPLVAIPATFAVIAGATPHPEVRVSVTALKGGPNGMPVVLDQAIVQAPSDRVAALWMVLARSCEFQVVATTAGFQSTCAGDETCAPATGMCVSDVVDPSTLPTYVPGSDLDAGFPGEAPDADATVGSEGMNILDSGGDGDASTRADTGIPADAMDGGASGSADATGTMGSAPDGGRVHVDSGAGDSAVANGKGPEGGLEAGDAGDSASPSGENFEGGPVKGGAVGDPCTYNEDCTGKFCQRSWCTASCKTSADCGISSSGVANVCEGAIAGNAQALCRPGCSETSTCRAFDPKAWCVPQNSADGKTVATCVTPDPLPDGGTPTGKDGDSCVLDTDCASGFCNGAWCTEVCASDLDCGQNGAGTANACVPSKDGLSLCFPGCSESSACKALGPQFWCTPWELNGMWSAACSSELLVDSGTPTGKDGDKCQMNDDCLSGSCVGWCTEVCAADQDCGQNSAGYENACAPSDRDNLKLCFAGCRGTSDCAAFGPYVCKQDESVMESFAFCLDPELPDGGLAAGKNGDTCETNDACASTECHLDPSGAAWCTEVCNTSQSCGSSSAVVPNACVINGLGLYKCVPTCTGAAECPGASGCHPATTIEMNAVNVCGTN